MENVWKKYTKADEEKITSLTEEYKKFLNLGKTERECCEEIIKKAEAKGFKKLDDYLLKNIPLKTGDKIYVNNMNKAIALFIIGKDKITNGMNILGAHIDSPRLDLKATPLYEESELAYFDTHYYGGIKKYQWVALPLALHGVIVKKDGTKVTVKIGEEPTEPVLGITDLLPHLASEQMKKEASKVIEGEDLDVLIGSKPLTITKDKDKNLVKENILHILQEKYAITEADFLSAELEIVPAGGARDFGLDKSMIMAYGQDDRVCAFTSLEAFLNSKVSSKTLSCILVDKEEIGSVGATGMYSQFYKNTITEICILMQETLPNATNRVLQNSKMLSSDVNSAYDPLYASVSDKRSASYLNKGLVFCKYTGSRGKSGSNDANCEYLALLRKIMDDNDVSFQISELGKIDAGGGGTIAYILANENVEVVDCGIGILNMHAPWEISAKADIYEVYKGYIAFLENA